MQVVVFILEQQSELDRVAGGGQDPDDGYHFTSGNPWSMLSRTKPVMM